jgi:hypothetical protein
MTELASGFCVGYFLGHETDSPEPIPAISLSHFAERNPCHLTLPLLHQPSSSAWMCTRTAMLTRREQAREETATWNDRMRVMNTFMKKRPSAEEATLRELAWMHLMKTYGYPALEVATWEDVSS